jgi:hypothetical protein
MWGSKPKVGKIGVQSDFVVSALRRAINTAPVEVVFWAVGAMASLNVVSEINTLRNALERSRDAELTQEIISAIEMLRSGS